jgi:hypothetical protein
MVCYYLINPKEPVMKKFITFTMITMLAGSSAYAADDKSSSMQNGMMQGDMMKNCQSHMKDGKMMGNMSKDMMDQCQKMMHQNDAKDTKPGDTSKPADDTAHAKHHE